LNNFEKSPQILDDSNSNFFYLKGIIYAASGYFLYLAIKKTFSKKFNTPTIDSPTIDSPTINSPIIDYKFEDQYILNEVRTTHQKAHLAKVLNPYQLKLIFPESKYQRNIIIPEWLKKPPYDVIQDKVFWMDYRSGRYSSLTQLRFLIENHDRINLPEEYDRNTFKAVAGRPYRLNLLSKYNQKLSPEFQKARQDLLNLLLEFEQLRYENNIEKKVD
jgi:hypothetical protein